MFQVTKEWLEVFRTDRGGYTMDQVRCLGYANGFKTKNWKKKAVGLWISEEAKNMFEELSENVISKLEKREAEAKTC